MKNPMAPKGTYTALENHAKKKKKKKKWFVSDDFGLTALEPRTPPYTISK